MAWRYSGPSWSRSLATKTSSFGSCVRTTRRSRLRSECPPGPKRSSNVTFKLGLSERFVQGFPIVHTDYFHNAWILARTLEYKVLNSFPLLPDQHWSQDQRLDQVEHEDAHHSVLRWCPEGRLQPNGERLLPALPEVRHLSSSAGLYVRIYEDVKKTTHETFSRWSWAQCWTTWEKPQCAFVL